MSLPNPSTALATVVVDELARNGVDFITLSPGSRSAALAIAASRHPDVDTRVVIDERSAAFQALGRSKATGKPAVAVSTSGTAPANYLPAVVEADMSVVPLIVVSADRPAELRGVGANQTIEQKGLFGEKVRREIAIEAPGLREDLNGVWRSAVSELVAASRGSRGAPGPVHMNIAFREPTVPVQDDGRSLGEPYAFDVAGRDSGRPWLEIDRALPPRPSVGLPETARGMLIAGDAPYDSLEAVRRARAAGWLVLATALSGARTDGVLTAYHHLLSAGVPDSLRPEVIVTIGSVGPSDRLEDLVASADMRIRVDPAGRVFDPRRNATKVIHADPLTLLDGLGSRRRDSGWAHGWESADRRARKSMIDHLSSETELSGAAALKVIGECEWDTLVAASSLPIREVDAHVSRPGRIIANRGASGIDGFVSTSLGVASAEESTVAVAGDLSLLHDSNGFLSERRGDLVVVVLDNDGGGLFDTLPQARHAPDFERLFITPHGRNLGLLAEFHSLGFADVATAAELCSAVNERVEQGGQHLVRVGVDRAHDLKTRRKLDELGALAAGSGQL